jgi:hypothetical protein
MGEGDEDAWRDPEEDDAVVWSLVLTTRKATVVPFSDPPLRTSIEHADVASSTDCRFVV